MDRVRITFTVEELDWLDDAMSYYRLAGMGEGEPTEDAVAMWEQIQAKIERGRDA